MSSPTPTAVSARRVAAASLAGTAVEYYDFAIYGLAAALIFPGLFFPQVDPIVGSLSAFATFAVGFLARPIGGVLFGHFGDRIGRKPMLALTLIIMGACTFAIGLLPGFDVAGPAAPIALILLRIVQGVAFGGEWGGAVLMAFEYAPEGRRAFFASIPQVGPVAGASLGNIVFALVALMPHDALLSWGWRIPFLASAVLVVLGILIRARIAESPEFVAAQVDENRPRIPLVRVLRHNPARVLLVAGGYVGYGSMASIAISYIVSYGTGVVGYPPSTVLWIVLGSNLVQIPFMLLSGHIADRWGMRRVMVAGPLAAMVGVFVLFAATDTGSPVLMFVGFVVGMSICYAVAAGALPALFADAFPANVRYTGMSLGYQLANVVGTGLTPFMATLIFSATRSGFAVAGYVAVALLVSLVCLGVLVTLERRTRTRDVERASTAGVAA